MFARWRNKGTLLDPCHYDHVEKNCNECDQKWNSDYEKRCPAVCLNHQRCRRPGNYPVVPSSFKSPPLYCKQHYNQRTRDPTSSGTPTPSRLDDFLVGVELEPGPLFPMSSNLYVYNPASTNRYKASIYSVCNFHVPLSHEQIESFPFWRDELLTQHNTLHTVLGLPLKFWDTFSAWDASIQVCCVQEDVEQVAFSFPSWLQFQGEDTNIPVVGVFGCTNVDSTNAIPTHSTSIKPGTFDGVQRDEADMRFRRPRPKEISAAWIVIADAVRKRCQVIYQVLLPTPNPPKWLEAFSTPKEVKLADWLSAMLPNIPDDKPDNKVRSQLLELRKLTLYGS